MAVLLQGSARKREARSRQGATAPSQTVARPSAMRGDDAPHERARELASRAVCAIRFSIEAKPIGTIRRRQAPLDVHLIELGRGKCWVFACAPERERGGTLPLLIEIDTGAARVSCNGRSVPIADYEAFLDEACARLREYLAAPG
jgi:hypothetical protein